jgi:hypothetical protein
MKERAIDFQRAIVAHHEAAGVPQPADRASADISPAFLPASAAAQNPQNPFQHTTVVDRPCGVFFFHCGSLSNGRDRAIGPPPSALLTLLITHFKNPNHLDLNGLYPVAQQPLGFRGQWTRVVIRGPKPGPPFFHCSHRCMHGYNDFCSGVSERAEDAILQGSIAGPEFQFVPVSKLCDRFDLGKAQEMLFSQYTDEGYPIAGMNT